TPWSWGQPYLLPPAYSFHPDGGRRFRRCSHPRRGDRPLAGFSTAAERGPALGVGTKAIRGAVVRISRTAAPLMAATPDQSSVSMGPSAREEPLRRPAFALCLPKSPWVAVSR